jgi:alpha-glucosidase
VKGGWASWSVGNHDVQRVASRWGGPGAAAFAKLVLAMQLSLKGTPCLYQGDELAFAEADVPFELLQDPYGITFWPEFKGRDGCRTPIAWTDAANGGFTTASRGCRYRRTTWPRRPRQEQAMRSSLAFHPPHRGAASTATAARRHRSSTRRNPCWRCAAMAGQRSIIAVFNLRRRSRQWTAASAGAEQLQAMACRAAVRNGRSRCPLRRVVRFTA